MLSSSLPWVSHVSQHAFSQSWFGMGSQLRLSSRFRSFAKRIQINQKSQNLFETTTALLFIYNLHRNQDKQSDEQYLNYLWLITFDTNLIYLMQCHLIPNNFSERIVLFVQPLACTKSNETILNQLINSSNPIKILKWIVVILLQLRSRCIRSWIRHTDNTWFIMSNLIMVFIIELSSEYWRSSSPCSCRISSLNLSRIQTERNQATISELHVFVVELP